jgi:hypothetical protein
MSVALNRMGNNINQVARRLNEAKVWASVCPSLASRSEIRDLVFDVAD